MYTLTSWEVKVDFQMTNWVTWIYLVDDQWVVSTMI